MRVDACASAKSTVGPDDAVITAARGARGRRWCGASWSCETGLRVAEDAEGAEGGIGRPVASAAPRMFS